MEDLALVLVLAYVLVLISMLGAVASPTDAAAVTPLGRESASRGGGVSRAEHSEHG